MGEARKPGEVAVVQAGEGEAFWQPVPANGFVEIKLTPRRVRSRIRFALGTQTVAPGGFVREHAHAAADEIIHVLAGRGVAVIDGAESPMAPGTTLFLGAGHAHRFVNTGEGELTFLWCIMPEGLEDFFAAVGRPRRPGEAAPEPFARPAEVLAIEAATGFVPSTDPLALRRR
ncbi:MAG: cupin domain-containing protein [Rhodospirillaceae bacterium]|nr:cupin domain-containing protein [Rhodospirillaceae bacterium]